MGTKCKEIILKRKRKHSRYESTVVLRIGLPMAKVRLKTSLRRFVPLVSCDPTGNDHWVVLTFDRTPTNPWRRAERTLATK